MLLVNFAEMILSQIVRYQHNIAINSIQLVNIQIYHLTLINLFSAKADQIHIDFEWIAMKFV